MSGSARIKYRTKSRKKAPDWLSDEHTWHPCTPCIAVPREILGELYAPQPVDRPFAITVISVDLEKRTVTFGGTSEGPTYDVSGLRGREATSPVKQKRKRGSNGKRR